MRVTWESTVLGLTLSLGRFLFHSFECQKSQVCGKKRRRSVPLWHFMIWLIYYNEPIQRSWRVINSDENWWSTHWVQQGAGVGLGDKRRFKMNPCVAPRVLCVCAATNSTVRKCPRERLWMSPGRPSAEDGVWKAERGRCSDLRQDRRTRMELRPHHTNQQFKDA